MASPIRASASPGSSPAAVERARQRQLLADAEAAFRDALIDSLDRLELCDRNLLGFRYVHGLGADQLAEVLCRRRAAVVRQLARIRERVLREIRRGLAARLRLDQDQLDRLLDVARSQLDVALARALRG